MSNVASVESGWNFEQGDLALFGVDADGFRLWLGCKHPERDQILFNPADAGMMDADPGYKAKAIPLQEAAGFARRILRTLALAGYTEEVQAPAPPPCTPQASS